MILKRLVAKNFRSFKDLDLTFPDRGLILLQGHSLTTLDGSGTGKTSIFLAIAYALDLMPSGMSVAEQKTWNSEGPTSVGLEIEFDDKRVVLVRGDKPSVTVIQNGQEKTVAGAKTYPTALKEALGVSAEILKAICYREQGESSMFLSQGDADRKAFLAEVLGLQKIEDALEVLSEQIKTDEYALGSVCNNLEHLLQEAREIQIPATPELDIDEAQKEIGRIHAELSSNVPPKINNWGSIAAEESLVAAQTRLSSHIAYSNGHERELVGMQHRVAELKNAIRTNDEKIKNLKSVKGNKCPTCKQIWTPSEPEILHMESEIQDPDSLASALNTANLKIEDLVAKCATAKIAANEANLAVNDLRQAAESAKRAAAEEHQNTLNEYRIANQSKFNRLQELTTMVTEYQVAVARRESEIAKASKVADKIQSLESEKNRLTAPLNVKKDLYSVLGRSGFMGAITETVLGEISDIANSTLAKLSNVSNVTVRLTSETTLRSGKTKGSISLEVFVGGVPVKFKSGLSGGMQTSVAQAIDFAILSVLQRRSGVFPGFILLDEVFNGQGLVTKESSMEILKDFAQTKLVMVIDHDSNFKEMFDKTIDIQHDGMYSRVV